MSQAMLSLQFTPFKGVVGKKQTLEIDGAPQELREGLNQIAVLPGRHKVQAYMRNMLGGKICTSKPLFVDVADGQTVELVYHACGGAFSKEFRLEIRGQEAPPPAGVPGWAWLFAIPCILIPVVALGGAIPAVLGFGGMAGCISVARARQMPAAARVLICLVITVAAWALFGVMLMAFVK